MSQGADTLIKWLLQHHPPISLSLMIGFSRFWRGDHPNPTSPEIEGLPKTIL
jgi:hypothetical protein